MRRYEGDVYLPGYGKVFADPKSSEGKYGLGTPPYMDSSNPDFLREGDCFLGHLFRVFQLTQPSNGKVIVEAEQFSGVYAEMGISEKWITWKN